MHALAGAILLKGGTWRANDDPYHRMAYRLFNYEDD
jgi:hypothetical protein